MKIKFKLLLLAFMASSFFNFSYAGDESPKVALVYANGMLNSLDDRSVSLQSVKNRLKTLYSKGKIEGVDKSDFDSVKGFLATNKSEYKDSLDPNDNFFIKVPKAFWGALSEAAEVFVDYTEETPHAIIEYLLDTEEKSKDIHENNGLMSIMKDAYAQMVEKVYEYTDKDLKNQFTQYREDIFSKDYHAVVFSHSHGNLITRKVYYNLVSREYINDNSSIKMKDRFYLMSVGSPVKMEMAMSKNFLLDVKDPIGYLSTIDWSDKVNKNDGSSFFSNNHSFESYMNKKESSDRINNFLKKSVESIVQEVNKPQDKFITIDTSALAITGGYADVEYEVWETSYEDEDSVAGSKFFGQTSDDYTDQFLKGSFVKGDDGSLKYTVNLKDLKYKTEIYMGVWNKSSDTVQMNYDIDAVDLGNEAIIDFVPYYNRDLYGTEIPYFIDFGYKVIITRGEDVNDYDIQVERVYPNYNRVIEIEITGSKLSALSSLNICEIYSNPNPDATVEMQEYCKTVKGSTSFVENKDQPYYKEYMGQDIAGNASYSSGILTYRIDDYTTNNEPRKNIDPLLYPKGELRNLYIEAGSNDGLDESTRYSFNVKITTSWRTVTGKVQKSNKYGGKFLFMYAEPGVDYINLID
tara:strand:+ start:3447 stop:5348 length:1902 start_codon:yes stop_codon:yes gene_type:complete